MKDDEMTERPGLSRLPCGNFITVSTFTCGYTTHNVVQLHAHHLFLDVD